MMYRHPASHMEHKRVLVQIGSNKRPVVFPSEGDGGELLQLKKAVIDTFRDVLNTTDANDLLVQVKSEEWGGEFVDILETDVISDKSVIKVTTAEVSLTTTLVMKVYFSSPFQQSSSSSHQPAAIKASAAITSTSAGSSGLTQMRLSFSQEQEQMGLRRPSDNVCKNKLELTFC